VSGTTTTQRADGTVELERAALRTPRAAGVAGLVFAALFSVSLLLLRPPRSDSSAAFARWYSGEARSTLLVVGLYLVPFAGIAFLWFIGVIRDRIGHREDRFFATVFLGSGLLFVAMIFAAAACATALALRVEALGAYAADNAGVLRFAQALSYAFLYVYAARAAGVFVIMTSTITLRTAAAPRWMGFLGYAIALGLLLSVRYFQYVIILFPVWVALLSGYILLTAGKAAGSLDGEAASK
jgi:hypothetical protein